MLDGGPDPPMGRGKFLGQNGRPIVKYMDTVICAKTAESMEMPFGLSAGMDPIKESCISYRLRRC